MVTKEKFTSELKEFAQSIDIDVFGISDLTLPHDQAKIGRRPEDLFGSSFKSLILFGCGMIDSLTKSWAQDDLVHDVSSIALNELSLRELKLKRFLRQNGYNAIGSDDSTGMFSTGIRLVNQFERAGLGYMGKSSLIITEKYGPRLNLWSIATDAPLIADKGKVENKCGSCKMCQTVCTSGAIMPDKYYNSRQCEAIVNCVPNRVFFGLSGWHDCDMCLRMCPQGEYKWEKEERTGSWWDIVERNRQANISKQSKYLEINQ